MTQNSTKKLTFHISVEARSDLTFLIFRNNISPETKDDG